MHQSSADFSGWFRLQPKSRNTVISSCIQNLCSLKFRFGEGGAGHQTHLRCANVNNISEASSYLTENPLSPLQRIISYVYKYNSCFMWGSFEKHQYIVWNKFWKFNVKLTVICKGKKFFFSLKGPEIFWGPSSLMLNMYGGSFTGAKRPVFEVEHSPAP